jgi:PhnB protein
MSVPFQPAKYHTVSPYLLVADAAGLIDFLKTVFDATVVQRHERGDGSVGHAEVKIGDTIVMMGGVQHEWKPMAASLYIYVADVDAAYARALKHGATSVMAPSQQFYGDKMGGITDPGGNLWWIATRTEEITRDEIARRARDNI